MSGGYVMNEDGTLRQPETNATVPKLNSAALQFTPEGAELAARYFVESLEYAWETGDVSPLRNLCSSESNYCSRNIDEIQETYDSGGWVSGLDYRTTETKHIQLLDPSSGFSDTYGLVLAVTSAAHAAFDDEGLSQLPEEKVFLSILVSWMGDHWQVTSVDSETTDV